MPPFETSNTLGNMSNLAPIANEEAGDKPSREEAEEAVRTLIRWAGDNPNREGLIDTPARVVRSYEELFAGYQQSPEEVLARTFDETDSYDDFVFLKNIRLESVCEHHMLPILGQAHVAYIPNGQVVGISKLARLVNVFAKRLQIQEKLTAQIANAINDVLEPRGVAVIIEASHGCMTTRGVHTTDCAMTTRHMIGAFKEDADLRRDLLAMIARDT